ncbi:hypothetical protein EON65_32420 [archaeon]|nr:MAG: hypothetical protein EON65_32420 [archaeon]
MAAPMCVTDCFDRVFPTKFTEEDKQKLMKVTVPIPRGERTRLEVIRTTGLLFKKPEGFLDRYTSLVTRVFKVYFSSQRHNNSKFLDCNGLAISFTRGFLIVCL